jgi:hypothetical protein
MRFGIADLASEDDDLAPRNIEDKFLDWNNLAT